MLVVENIIDEMLVMTCVEVLASVTVDNERTVVGSMDWTIVESEVTVLTDETTDPSVTVESEVTVLTDETIDPSVTVASEVTVLMDETIDPSVTVASRVTVAAEKTPDPSVTVTCEVLTTVRVPCDTVETPV